MRIRLGSILLLLLATIVNIAVVWGCAVFTDGSGTQLDPFGVSRADGVLWKVARFDKFGPTIICSSQFQDHGLQYSRFLRQVDVTELLPYWGSIRPSTLDLAADDPLLEDSTLIEARGWPLRCLMLRYDGIVDLNANAPISTSQRGVLETGLSVVTWGGGGWSASRHLPYLPIWPGLTANVLLYASILWLAFLGPGALRRMLRRRRGLCPFCGYDLRGAPASPAPHLNGGVQCPECGGRSAEMARA